jgi:hypothetical protein
LFDAVPANVPQAALGRGASAQASLQGFPPVRRSLSRVAERRLLWTYAFSAFFVLVEPAPVDFLFLLVAPAFMLVGLTLHRSAVIPISLLITFNIGGILALVPFADKEASVRFVVVSLFLSAMGLLFVALLSDRSIERLQAIRSGTIWAGVAASVAGILGFFDVLGAGGAFSLYGRASGTFKDPNVLGTFLILPLAFTVQTMLVGDRFSLRNAVLGTVIVAGIFLSFSRGAWAHTAGTLGLLLLLNFALADSSRIRRRVLIICVFGLILLTGLILAALSVDAIQQMFAARATLDQGYDLGETGRFGNQLRSIGELMELPNGYGPIRFRFHFPEDPHNVYVNAFASYGWLGGFSYIALVLTTVVIGWRTVVKRQPEQPYVIAIWSVLFIQFFQGLQIDTDHWRHWFMMLGMIWGLYAVSQKRPPAFGASRGQERASRSPPASNAGSALA